ncbi:hypothetical protein BJX99DRAFT_234107 [Aspergillus californicus]
MDSKIGYNGYPSAQPPSWGQETPAPAYGYPQHPQDQYPQSYPQSQPQYPPSYTQPQNGYSTIPAEKTTASTASYPRGLEVSFTGWTGRHMSVTEDTHDGPVVYAADLKNRKPHMLFQATGTARLPATVVFHSFSRTIDVTVNGQEIPLHPNSIWKCEHGFESIALAGKKLTWKKASAWKFLDMECVDEAGVLYATFKGHKGWSAKKTGRLEMLEPCKAGEKGLADEIVVTGVAKVYLQITQTVGANAAAGASAGAAAAVSA